VSLRIVPGHIAQDSPAFHGLSSGAVSFGRMMPSFTGALLADYANRRFKTG
jgi:hypothetical protein